MPTPTKYSYKISINFASLKIDSTMLLKEILNSNINTLIERIDTDVLKDICDIWFQDLLSVEDKTTLDNIVNNHPTLEDSKQFKYEVIDRRTDQLIETGFNFIDKKFSLSIDTQIRLIAMYLKKSDISIYPFIWYTIDNLDTIEIKDESELTDFYNAAFNTIQLHSDSGLDVKNQIKLATTISEVEAIIDNR